MKRKTLLTALLLLCAMCMNAATVDVKIPLWSGTLTCTDGWGGGQQVAADGLQQAATGAVRQ